MTIISILLLLFVMLHISLKL